MTQADFLNSDFPESMALTEDALDGPGRFVNREMSWLGFNWRVLEEAGCASCRSRLPISMNSSPFGSQACGNLKRRAIPRPRMTG